MTDTARIIEQYGAAEVEKQKYLDQVRSFITACNGDGAQEGEEALRRVHAAAVAYFNVFERVAGFTESLSTTSEWRRRLAEDCAAVLTTRMRHQEFLVRNTRRFGLDVAAFTPGAHAYSAMQRLVRDQLPDEAASLSVRLQAVGLPVAGFGHDAPRSTVAPSPVVTPWPKKLKGKVDFAIITIKDEEFKAVINALPPEPARSESRARGYSLRFVPQPDGPPALIAVTQCVTGQGNGTAQDVCRDVIGDLDPQWILCVGIAGAAPVSEIALGDVLLGSAVIDTSVEAIKKGEEPVYSVETVQAHHLVQNYCAILHGEAANLGAWFELWDHPFDEKGRKPLDTPRIRTPPKEFYGDAEWTKRTRKAVTTDKKSRPRPPRVTSGLIAASDRLVKDDAVLARWMKAAKRIMAVEMESAGVYRAALGRGRSRKGYPAMTIRGISDVVGLKRDDEWTPYACATAAAFAHAFIRSGHVKSRRQ